jgi:hypothetical protein
MPVIDTEQIHRGKPDTEQIQPNINTAFAHAELLADTRTLWLSCFSVGPGVDI